MKVIGLTGGIGSGKSYVGSILENMGYHIYYSDNRAKNLMNQNQKIKNGLLSLLGNEAYIENKINREFIAQKLFSKESIRDKVNQLVHPVVREDFEQWKHSKKEAAIVFNEAAILFETGAYKGFDAVILVHAPTETKLKRLKKRDGSTEEVLIKKMKAQWSDLKKRSLTPYHLLNDGVEPIDMQLQALIKAINKSF